MTPEKSKWTFFNTVVGIIAGLIVIGLFFGNVIEDVYHYFSDDLRIVIRKERFIQNEDFDLLKLSFSLVNVSRELTHINSLNLRVGDYVASPFFPFMMYASVAKFSHKLNIGLIRDSHTGNVVPLLSQTHSEQSMGTQLFSLLGDKRIRLDREEQVDFELEILLERPKDLAGKYKKVWDLGGQIRVEYELPNLNKGSVSYPRRLGA